MLLLLLPFCCWPPSKYRHTAWSDVLHLWRYISHPRHERMWLPPTAPHTTTLISKARIFYQIMFTMPVKMAYGLKHPLEGDLHNRQEESNLNKNARLYSMVFHLHQPAILQAVSHYVRIHWEDLNKNTRLPLFIPHSNSPDPRSCILLLSNTSLHCVPLHPTVFMKNNPVYPLSMRNHHSLLWPQACRANQAKLWVRPATLWSAYTLMKWMICVAETESHCHFGDILPLGLTI